MGDEASSSLNSRREFLKAASLLAVSGYALPATALQRDCTRAPAPTIYWRNSATATCSLAPGLPRSQFEHTQGVMLRMDVDSLLKPYRLRAGLPAPGPGMGGWYDLVSDAVRAQNKDPYGGHGFAPGHAFGQWISALARGYAASGNPAARVKVEKILAAYEPAISGRFYANFPFPAYNYDKIVCGLIDAHSYCGLESAFPLLDRTTDVAEPHLPPRALDRGDPQKRWRQSIGESTSGWYLMDESYTLGENLFLAWQRRAGRRYLPLARRFLLDDTFFAPLAAGQQRAAQPPRLQLCQRAQLRGAGLHIHRQPHAPRCRAQRLRHDHRPELRHGRLGTRRVFPQARQRRSLHHAHHDPPWVRDALRKLRTPQARPLPVTHHARRALRRQHGTGLPQHGAGREKARGRWQRVLLFGLQLQRLAHLLPGSLAVLLRHVDRRSPRTTTS